MNKVETKNEIKNDCLFVKVTGLFDINIIAENIAKVGKELHNQNLKKLFLDITEEIYTGTKQKSVFTMYEISSLMFKSHPIGTKVCLLVTKEQFDENKFFDNTVTNKGFPIKVTTNREEGLKFLGVSLEEKS